MVRSRPSQAAVCRALFGAAAVYNIVFGAWAVLFPSAFFNWFGLDTPRYPGIWSCLGMVIGVYGIGYAYIAWKPDQGDLLAIVDHGHLMVVLGAALMAIFIPWATLTGLRFGRF